VKLKPYPKYKPSGIEWLGDVPAHWQITPLKFDFRIVGGSTPKSERPEYWDGEIVWVSPSDLSKRSSLRIASSQRKITAEGLASCGTSLVPAGSIVLSTRAPIGSTAVADIELCTNQGCKSLVPNASSNPWFYIYLLLVNTEELNVRGKGTTFLELSSNELGAFKVGVPSIDEQRLIASFLDRETAKIDTLIGKQEKLIELLKEKRQAVICHAVTKGLDPNVPMKSSGVEWIGDVPEHWDLSSLKRGTDFITSGSRGWSEHYADQGSIFIRIGNLTRDRIDLDLSELQFVDVPVGSEGERTRVRPDDVLISITAYLGSVAVVPSGLGNAYVSQHVALARPLIRKILPRWIAYTILSTVGQSHFATQGYGGTKIQLSLEDVRSLPMLMPSLAEQGAIVAFVDKATTKIDTLIAKAQQAIELQKEHRTALISAAVTGKIDVRGMVQQEVSEAKAA